MDDETVYDILLAATEACTNVLTHGGHQIRGYTVVTRLGAVGCQVEVTDDGFGVMPAPDPTEAVPPGPARFPALAQLPDSGRAWQSCEPAWTSTLDSRPAGTVVTLRKHIRWPEDAPLRQLRAAS